MLRWQLVLLAISMFYAGAAVACAAVFGLAIKMMIGRYSTKAPRANGSPLTRQTVAVALIITGILALILFMFFNLKPGLVMTF
jgi:hypothetical protein